MKEVECSPSADSQIVELVDERDGETDGGWGLVSLTLSPLRVARLPRPMAPRYLARPVRASARVLS